ncbi:Detected protein of confused Function [Hibiscus syriacus]|uniref:Detected protein of confused Function n=1 Tax=Hibiscus syriacus TaxID=106335 RepID=A0A6A2YAP8_HIBSY|nr:Detected protein of confused Function [Hibiscus syriacus]
MDYVLNKIDKHLENHRSLDQHLNDLKRKLKDLDSLKEDAESRMSTELRPTKKLKTEVQMWLENVERIDGEARKLDGRIGESRALARGFHSDDVLKMVREVEELIQQGKFHEGLVVDDPRRIGQVLSTTTLSGEDARTCVEEIWQCLMDDEVRKIGVWGMGGVGKTSILKVINNQLLKETGKFDIVIWVTVSKQTSIGKLQKDIASKIGVTLSGDEDEITRAGMLFETLSRKSRFVVILDDLWEKISSEVIGIPELCTGSKLVLTTRSFDVCRQMDCRVIKVNPLEERHAWNLFLEKVGVDILNIPGLEPVAKSIAKCCAGLPLAIVTVAACMRGIDDLFEWRNALNELSVHKKCVGLEDEVFHQLQFSYDRLKDPKIQRCFLSCALYPEDFSIREKVLIQLWIAEGLVEEMDSRQAEYGRHVKMHDLVREMALHITSAKPRFFVKAGTGLTKPPDMQEWSKDLEKVSLMGNWELEIPYPSGMLPPKCPMLTTLLLSDCGIMSIPDGFFDHMHGLKILDLSKNPIMSLPNSISNLKGLTRLSLALCLNLKKVPSLSNLQVLKELDLEGTNIKSVPHGMKNMLSLKYLNLGYSRNPIVIPNGILSRLSCLQELIVGETLIRGEEVHGLNKLEFLEGRFYDVRDLNMYVQALHDREEPREYKIRVGKRGRVVMFNSRKYIELCGCNIYSNQIMLPCDVKELYIKKCYLACSEEHLFSRFIQVSVSSFSSLKFLQVSDCRNMKKLFSPNCVPLHLQQLRVRNCDELEEIIASELEPVERGMFTVEFCLPKLRQLELIDLPELKSICGVGRVMVCNSLEEIRVEDCLKLKRMPLSLPQLVNVQQSGPLSLSIYLKQGVVGISGMGSSHHRVSFGTVLEVELVVCNPDM